MNCPKCAPNAPPRRWPWLLLIAALISAAAGLDAAHSCSGSIATSNLEKGHAK